MKALFVVAVVVMVIFLKHDNKTRQPPPPESVRSMQVFRQTAKSPAAKMQTADQAKDVLTTQQLKKEIKNIEMKLSVYSGFSFTQFTDIQLVEFNTLVRKKAELLKEYIFRKYSNQYGGNTI